MLVRCHDCEREFVVDLVENEIEAGLTAVGFECPWCHRWHHSYYSSANLKRKRQRLQKFRAKAGRSATDWAWYQRKRREFTTAFNRINRVNTGTLR